jgi:long-subunit acyl-CoA synthetase (AMP-forming)
MTAATSPTCSWTATGTILRTPSTPARDASGWQNVTAGHFLDQVTALAKGLIAGGLAPGDTVGVLSATRYEWTLVDFAIWFAGGVTVPIYETSSASQVEWILSDSGAGRVFVEDRRKAVLLDQVLSAPASWPAAWCRWSGWITTAKPPTLPASPLRGQG